MNNLPREKQIEAVAALTEGVSVRATERLTGVNRGTILSLGVRVGQGCATALSATHKAIVSYQIGKRSGANANAFAMDVRQRILGRPQISSDGFSPYIDAIERAFGSEVDYGQIV